VPLATHSLDVEMDVPDKMEQYIEIKNYRMISSLTLFCLAFPENLNQILHNACKAPPVFGLQLQKSPKFIKHFCVNVSINKDRNRILKAGS